jgi:hypothetical protein
MRSTKSKTSRDSDSSNVTASTLTNSSSLPSVVHLNEAAFNAMVGKIVNENVFPKKQFIILEKELDSQGKLASKCLAALHMERSQWHTVKELVRKRLNRKRNNTQLSVRRNLFRKYIAGHDYGRNDLIPFVYWSVGYLSDNGPESIELNSILEGRRERKSFHWFLDEIASVVVGTSVFEQVKCVKLPSEWLSPSLEAFGLLCIENYFERMKGKANQDEKVSEPKWTAEGRGSRKYQGWKQEGIRRYNVLVNRVRSDRSEFGKEDEIYLQVKNEERVRLENDRLRKRQVDLDSRENGIEAAADDFSSDSEAE